MKKLLPLMLALIMLASMLSACGNDSGSGSAAAPSTGGAASAADSSEPEPAEDYSETGVLNMSWPSDTGSDLLPPAWAGNSYYSVMLFDSLVYLDGDGKTIVPNLAKDFSVSPDAMTYTFTIEEGATWHDGQPVTMEDIVWSIDSYILFPESQFSYVIANIEGADKVQDGSAASCSGISTDGNTLTIQLAEARSDFLIYLACVSILPKHLLEDVDPALLSKDETFWTHPIGSGPYKVDEVNIPNYFTMVRNEEYWGARAGIKNVKFTSYVNGGADAVTADLIAGNLDLVMGGSINDINRAESIISGNPDITMTMVPATYARYFVFNTTGSTDGRHNDDVMKTEVRQAFNLLLDKDSIANFYEGQAVPLTTYVNPESSDYNRDIPLFERDVETAKQMLEEAGFDFSRPIRLLYYYKDQVTADIMELAKQNFAEAGVTVETSLVTGSIVDVMYEQRNWDIGYFGNYGLEPVDSFYYNICTVNPMINKITGNFDDIKTTVFDPLYNEYFATTDQTRKSQILDQFQVEAGKHMFTIPLYAMNKIILTNSAKLYYEPSVLELDIWDWVDYRFDTWKLLQP